MDPNAVNTAQKALSIPPILSEIIWLTHAGSCSDTSCLPKPFGGGFLDETCNYRGDHLITLSQCILVCKYWAKVGIPQLWGFYTSEDNLLSLLTDASHKYRWYNDPKPNSSVADVSFITLLWYFHSYVPYMADSSLQTCQYLSVNSLRQIHSQASITLLE